MIWIGIVISLFFIAFFGIGYWLSEPGHQGEKAPHFDGTSFINPNGAVAHGMEGLIKFLFTRKPEKWKKNYETHVRTEPLPEAQPGKTDITFVNHSTFLIQADGVNILTDPIWSERCSPFQWAGPERFRPPGLVFDDLPPIDLVCLTHNHYDHLDRDTVMRLNAKFEPTFIVPLGVEKTLHKWGCNKVISMEWWQSHEVHGIAIQSTPAIHFSGRGMFDRNKTLWCGFSFRSASHHIYYVGDTANGEIFDKISAELGSIDVALIPIGAYKPDWFMSRIHVSPSEAVSIHQKLNTAQSIAMHFGTFNLADDGQGIAERDLMHALQQANIPPDQFVIPDEGQSMRF